MKSLTLKGFKSFASSTTLQLEPGITAVVGPNGSGKSNVVDAIAWVLGEQGAKALRGGKMEDVIFAGTADRPPLGRAEVTLTINNADGALPIDYTEVSITRRMFRDGASEYEINGSSCRLLDIQELLSDSGIGREMHVIVGQGQLDAVLSARAEDRRAFIEEAAGVLKHRKRKEKALRKLDAMQANLTRLTDLTSELRRQLKPLGRQAEVARRAAGVQADLRDAKLRLAAHDYVQLAEQIAKETADEQAAVEHRERVQKALADATERAERAAAALAEATPTLQAAQDVWFALSALSERFRGTLGLAEERERNLSAEPAHQRSGRDPEELDRQAEQAEAEQTERQQLVAAATAQLEAAEQTRRDAEQRLRDAEAELVAAGRAIADRREGLARLSGQVNAARSRLASADDESARLESAVTEARQRAAQAEQQFQQLQDQVQGLDSSEIGLDEAHMDAEQAAQAAAARVAELDASLREAATEQTRLQARLDALTMHAQSKDGAGTLLAADLPGVLGPVATVLTVTPGYEAAVAAALGNLAEAVAVQDVSAAQRALERLREQDAGQVSLLVGDAAAPIEPPRPALPTGAVWAVDQVSAPAAFLPALRRLLGGVVILPLGQPASAEAGTATADAATAGAATADAGTETATVGAAGAAGAFQAAELLAAQPDLRVVTGTGELFGAGWAIGGSPGAPSVLEIQAAVSEAETALAAVQARSGELTAAHAGASAEAEQLGARARTALAALHESDAQLSAVTDQLGRLGATARSATAEAERLERQRDQVQISRQQHRDALADLEQRLAAATESDAGADHPDEVDPSARDAAAEHAQQVRQAEVEARLALRTAEERAKAGAGTAESLRRAARAERDARLRAEQAVRRRAAGAAVARRVVEIGAAAAEKLQHALETAARQRESAQQARQAAEQEAGEARAAVAGLQSEWDKLTDAVHRDEVQRAQQTLRHQQLTERIAVDFSMAPDDLVAEFGPDVPVPPTALEMGEYTAAKERGDEVSAPQPTPFDRGEQERRAKRAEKELALLGKVNPLALEEFAALEERHAFLSTQLEDIKSTRKDLLTVVKEVDDKILEVFTSAYHDVAREFVTVFGTLFPGGEGELVLTDPSDMLTTGIEVNARPPGKKVKRLSLLSGGERSLTAVALLVAIFRARPSPFYVMDEVEAALDETNLTRLVGLLSELRDSSQLIIITHQKFTMEAADALYGVSMRGDGITQVISQRIKGRADEPVDTPAPRATTDSAAAGVGTDVERSPVG
nr:AAA family ATPase [Nakamurella aerolata]